jgi:hypothetical protein
VDADLPKPVCDHRDLGINAEHVGLPDSNISWIRLHARCNICGVRMVFRCQGAALGLSPDSVARWDDDKELRLPFLPEGEAPIFKKAKAG